MGGDHGDTSAFYLFFCPNCGSLFDCEDENIPSLKDIAYPGVKNFDAWQLQLNPYEYFITETEQSVWDEGFYKTLRDFHNGKENPQGLIYIVPIPASPCTREQPGQISERLSHKIAEFGGWEFLNCLRKGANSGEVDLQEGIHVPTIGNFILVDDQLTKGTTMRSAQDALITAGIPLKSINRFVWSISEQHHQEGNQEAFLKLREFAEIDTANHMLSQ